MGSYSIYVHPEAWRAIKRSPGDVRQRLRRAISELASTPRPPASKQLETSLTALEVRRQRVEDWRIVYSINEDLAQVQVLAVRQRPPYDYRDLEALVKKVEEP
jgi:mRNA interferase RelE/StbE